MVTFKHGKNHKLLWVKYFCIQYITWITYAKHCCMRAHRKEIPYILSK